MMGPAAHYDSTRPTSHCGYRPRPKRQPTHGLAWAEVALLKPTLIAYPDHLSYEANREICRELASPTSVTVMVATEAEETYFVRLQ